MSVSNVQPLRADPDWRVTEATDAEAKVASLDTMLDALGELAEEFPLDDQLGHAARVLAAHCRGVRNVLVDRAGALRLAIRERENEARAAR